MNDFESESGHIVNRVVQSEVAGFSSEKLILILKTFNLELIFGTSSTDTGECNKELIWILKST